MEFQSEEMRDKVDNKKEHNKWLHMTEAENDYFGAIMNK